MFNKKHFDHRLDILELYLTVRDPSAPKSAEAFDGLRRQLNEAHKGTQIHLSHLASLHKVVTAADSLEPARAKLNEFMTQMGLSAVDDPRHPDLYQITGGKGSHLVVDVPAYLAQGENREAILVQQGFAHYEESPHHEESSGSDKQARGNDDDSHALELENEPEVAIDDEVESA